MNTRRYEIMVVGHDCTAVAEQFGDLEFSTVDGHTKIGGERLDASHLLAVRRQLDRLGLELHAITSRVEAPAVEEA